MSATALLLAARALVPLGEPGAPCRAALEQAYDGSTAQALARLAELNRERPDLLCAYTELLARAFDLEQHAPDALRDAEHLRRADALVAQADARLASDPRDPEARFVRGAAFGLRSRLHLSRWQKRAAAQTAARMRKELLLVGEGEELQGEALFGLGLYDYYADVLPRLLKLLRLLTGLPAGNRARGLQALEAARERTQLHRTEARVQLCDVYVYYEDRQDDALALLVELRREYPGAPLWGLRLAEHQRARLGQGAQSARAARSVLAQSADLHPNYAPVVGGIARVLLGEALLDEFEFGEARAALEPALNLVLPEPWRSRARLALGRSLESLGERGAAEAHYRGVLAGACKPAREAAERALREPLSQNARRARGALKQARQLAAQGLQADAALAYAQAARLDPGCQEAKLRLAEAQLLAGRLDECAGLLRRLQGEESPQPPWIRPWTALLAARLDDLRGRRAEALKAYNQVFKRPYGSAALKDLAAEGLRQPFRLPAHASALPEPANH